MFPKPFSFYGTLKRKTKKVSKLGACAAYFQRLCSCQHTHTPTHPYTHTHIHTHTHTHARHTSNPFPQLTAIFEVAVYARSQFINQSTVMNVVSYLRTKTTDWHKPIREAGGMPVSKLQSYGKACRSTSRLWFNIQFCGLQSTENILSGLNSPPPPPPPPFSTHAHTQHTHTHTHCHHYHHPSREGCQNMLC